MNPTTDHEKVWEMKLYYQQFHHTLMSWYITISGFIFAGLLVVDVEKLKGAADVRNLVLWCIGINALCFEIMIGHFDIRIERLNEIHSQSSIPADWEDGHKRFGWCLSGVGSYFFFVLVLLFGLANYLLLEARL